MKLNTKIFLCFAVIIFSSVCQIGITYHIQSRVLDAVRQIKNVEVPLEIIVQRIIGYDAMLTGHVHAALLHAQRGEFVEVIVHRAEYDKVAVLMDTDLKKNASMLIGQSRRDKKQLNQSLLYLQKLDTLNIKLVDFELAAFTAIENKDVEEAYSFIVGGEYGIIKDELYATYLEWAHLEGQITAEVDNDMMADIHKSVYSNSLFSIVNTILLILALLFVRSFVLESNKGYKTLYENSSDALMTAVPPDWKFSSGNAAAIKLFNLKDENQFTTLSPGDLSPERQPDGQLSSVKGQEMIKKALKEGSAHFAWTHKTYNGADFSADVLLSKVSGAGEAYLEATVRKIG